MSDRADYGVMRRENLAFKLALTYHQYDEADVAPAHKETLIALWLPVAEMAIHETLE